MPPNESFAALRSKNTAPAFHTRFEKAFTFIKGHVEEPGEPRLFRKVNISKFDVIPLGVPERMQMLIDECEIYLAMPMWTDKFGTNHHRVEDEGEPGRRDWRNDPASIAEYGADVMKVLSEENRLMVNNMTNIQIAARGLWNAMNSTIIESPDIDRLKASVEALYRAFGERVMTEEETKGMTDRVKKYMREQVFTLFMTKYKDWPNLAEDGINGKVPFVKEFSAKLREYLDVASS